MSNFINGMNLCEQFFREIAKPILDRHFPHVPYTAGLLGYGSDVLGFDDEVSTDHMWGPRFYLFLREQDIGLRQAMTDIFSAEFPCVYKGYSVNFSLPDPNDHGIRHAEFIDCGPVSPLIFIHTIDDFLQDYLGVCDFDTLSPVDWLALPEHRLLATSGGRLFADDLGIQSTLNKVRFYPHLVKMYLIASNWSLVAEEQAFVKRCASVGDELGSMLACARIAERLMRLCFLYCDAYAPYSKWFGTAFGQLPVDDAIKIAIRRAVAATDITEREDTIILAQRLVAEIHNSLGITKAVNIGIQKYFGRDIKVIFADKLCDAALETLRGSPLASLPLIGTMSEVANLTKLSDNPRYRNQIKSLYSD